MSFYVSIVCEATTPGAGRCWTEDTPPGEAQSATGPTPPADTCTCPKCGGNLNAQPHQHEEGEAA